eukprot:GFUD01140202.1.p1 GENE.GFUD01140202.1~~GFUD01140202.1.p1  ORF type:complete len:138 (-),score=23.89 GFUD01140202.1:2-415(-)
MDTETLRAPSSFHFFQFLSGVCAPFWPGSDKEGFEGAFGNLESDPAHGDGDGCYDQTAPGAAYHNYQTAPGGGYQNYQQNTEYSQPLFSTQGGYPGYQQARGDPGYQRAAEERGETHQWNVVQSVQGDNTMYYNAIQ